MKYRVKEYCNEECIKIKYCDTKQQARNTIQLWKIAPCENQRIEVEYWSDEEVQYAK